MTPHQMMILLEVCKLLYNEVLREAAEKSVKDSETKIDDYLLKLCDTVFEFKDEDKKQ